MKNNILLIILLFLAISGLALSIKNYLELKSLYCDLNKSIYAEREYTYPILRKIEDPMNYGPGSNDPRTKNILNPLVTDQKKLKHCN